jgi:hypothetical protein
LFRIINYNIERSDRRYGAFQTFLDAAKSDEPIGLPVLTQLFQADLIANPMIGFRQWIISLIVLIILTYFPRWVGCPIEENGRVTNERPFIPIIFQNSKRMSQARTTAPLLERQRVVPGEVACHCEDRRRRIAARRDLDA